MSKYAFGKKVNMGFDQAVTAVTQALAKEGFGVLTEIDVQATLKKKLGIERPPYRILGACNPQFAARARGRAADRRALPCNVVVRQDAGGSTPSWSSWTPTPSSSCAAAGSRQNCGRSARAARASDGSALTDGGNRG